jgi:hypothetical protein
MSSSTSIFPVEVLGAVEPCSSAAFYSVTGL